MIRSKLLLILLTCCVITLSSDAAQEPELPTQRIVSEKKKKSKDDKKTKSKKIPIDKDTLFWSTVRQARAIREGVFTSRDLLELMIEQYGAVNEKVNAIVTTDFEGARLAADAADAQIAAGETVGPLHGIPITVKDALETKGLRTTGGSMTLSENIPDRDAPAVKALKDAGAIVFGKTNVPEWSADTQTFNELFGRTNNPWDVTRTSGGSSGGAAVAVSTGMSSFEIGTDIGGSIRIPSSYCGIFGHKSSYGIVSHLGYLDSAVGGTVEPDTSVVGPLARSAEDLRMLLDVMLRKEGPLVASLPEPPDDPKSLKVAAWLDGSLGSLPVDSKVRAVFETAILNLEIAGVSVDRSARPNFDPHSIKEANDIATFLLLAASDSDTNTEFLPTHSNWLAVNRYRQEIRARWAEFFNEYDAILMPIHPTPPFLHNTDIDSPERSFIVDSDGIKRPFFVDANEWATFVSMAYLPSTVPPIGLTEDGLPVSFQVVGPYGGDYTTIKLAGYIAELNGGYQQPPVS